MRRHRQNLPIFDNIISDICIHVQQGERVSPFNLKQVAFRRIRLLFQVESGHPVYVALNI